MKTKSFTLIELLVVIVIIGILAGVIIVSTSSSINKANFAKAQSFSNTVQNELLGDLVSEWTFNSPAVSGKTEDSWGNNNGTLVGANGLPQIQTKENCVYGTCYLFDGVDDYIDCGNNSLNITNTITVSVWFKLNETSRRQAILSKHDYQVGGYEIRIDNNNLLFIWNYIPTQKGITYAGGLSTLKWYYVVAMLDGVYASLYLDGNLVKQSLDATYPATTTLNLQIGKGVRDGIFTNGSIDDVRIYKAALSTSQIKQEYIAGLNSLLANNSISKEEYDQRLNNLAYDKE